MKKYMALFGLFTAINSCNGQTGVTAAKTMLEEFHLKGKVKTVTYVYEKENHKLYFDGNGLLVKQVSVFPSYGDITGEIFDNYVYEDGKLQSFDVIRTFKSRTPLHIGKSLFEYNSSGLLISSDFLGSQEFYKYDKKGNRIERYGYLKTRQKFNAQGQVTEEWAFEDKETTVRAFGITDAQGNHLPDEEYVHQPYELPPKKYEHNEFGDVVRVTYMENSQPVTHSVTLKYDDAGNWIERTAGDNAAFYHYFTTEQIYTRRSFYAQRYIRRIIEYYEHNHKETHNVFKDFQPSKKFNILKFKIKNRKGEYSFVDDGVEVRQMENIDYSSKRLKIDGYYEYRKYPNCAYEFFSEYDKKGLLMLTVTTFYNIECGIFKRYNKLGNVVEEENLDAPYTFSIDDLIDKMKDEYDVDILNVGLVRTASRGFADEVNMPFYQVNVKDVTTNFIVHIYLIDGATGETLLTTTRETHKSGQPSETVIDEYIRKKLNK